MGDEYTKDTLRGLILPTGASISDASGLYLAGVLAGDLPVADSGPGRPEREGSEMGILESSAGDGTWAGTEVRAIVARGGHPDRQGAAFYLESDGTLYGWEAPSVLTSSRYLSSVGWSNAAICAHPDGLVAAGQAGSYYLRLLQLSADGTSITTTTNLSDQATVLTARTQPYSPALVCLPSGRVVCFFFGEESTGFWTLRSLYSDNQGATWEMLSPRIHPAAYDPASILPRRIRAAYNQGQILICVEYVEGLANAIAQLVSYDGGATATLVAGLDGTTAGLALGGGHDLAALPGGGFVLAYISQSDQYPYSYRIAAAEEAFAYASTQVQIVGAGTKWANLGGGYLTTDLDLVMVAAEDGALYLTARLAAGTDSWISLRSLDSGDTWEAMGDTIGLQAGAWHKTGVAGTGPYLAAGCWWKGGIALIHNSQSAVASAGADRLWMSRLGGMRSLTLPALESAGDEADQITWEKTWLPIDKPQDAGWTRTIAGAPTSSLTAGYMLDTSAGGESLVYSAVPAGSATGLGMEMEVEAVSGSSVTFSAAVDNTVYTYKVSCTLSTTTLTVADAYGGALGSLTIAGRAYFRIHLSASTVAVWGSTDGITWEAACESATLADGGGAIGTNEVKWGIGASTQAKWYRSEYTSGSYAGLVGTQDPPEQMGISGSLLVVRDGLHPRPIASSPAYFWDGLALALRSGPVAPGEAWTIQSASPYASENCLPAVRNSPRSLARWVESTVTADELRVVVDLDPSAAPPGILVGCYLDGLYGGPWTLSLYSGSAWVDLVTTPVYSFSGRLVVAGEYVSIRPSTAPNILLRWGELAGAAIMVWTDDTKTVLVGSGRVVSNSEGLIYSWSSTLRQARIIAEGLSASATVRTIEIFPRSAIAILDSWAVAANVAPAQIRLSCPVGEPFYGGLLGEIATLAAGPVAIFGKDYSLTRNVGIEPGGKLVELPGGYRLADSTEPARRVVEMAWVEGVDLSDVRYNGTDPTHIPDYVRWGTTSVPVAHRHDTALLVADILEQRNGVGTAVILPYIPSSGAPAWVASVDRARGAVYGVVTGSARLEQAAGTEERDDVVRVSTITLEELV